MDLSVITVAWNSSELIEEQIKSVKAGCKKISFEEIVVDNASTDKTVELIKKNFPGIKLVENSKNTGFAFPNNQAAKLAQGEFLLFLNPDMRVEEGSLDNMVEWMRAHVEVGLASCKLLDKNGSLNMSALPRRFPTVWSQVAIILKIPHLFPAVLDNYLLKGFDANIEQEVDSVRGSFMLMRRQVYEKLGWAFDPRYFIWFEDVDICREVKKMGLKVMYTPVVSCIDYIGQSFKKRDTLWKQKQVTKSMLQYFQKWEPWYKWIWIAIFRPFGIFMGWVNDLITKR
ncbi:MAG TPA: glycosyltransferase family 2 protein [Candidatus Udaeobacter sp.]|nr:glycosyltransferase family 2 protein [Candidatus Udaeobacter sp.]